jgi:hypothetical protein
MIFASITGMHYNGCEQAERVIISISLWETGVSVVLDKFSSHGPLPAFKMRGLRQAGPLGLNPVQARDSGKSQKD